MERYYGIRDNRQADPDYPPLRKDPLELFPMQDYWWFYLGFVAFVIAILSLDLGVFHKKAHEVSWKEASAWTLAWITLALTFNFGFYLFASSKFGAETGHRVALEFLTGYLTEKALALDNIFIFALLFSQFAIPKTQQHRLLFYGVFGALIFRGLLISAGSYLMNFHWVVVGFGALLLISGLKLLFSKEETQKPKGAWLANILEDRFNIRPFFVALIFIEVSDVIFAFDSVPAIFSLTKEPLIVFTSNIFAILGLRSMYFLLAGALDRFRYIKYGLAGVLVFVGLKMVGLEEWLGYEIPIVVSLGVIGGCLGLSILASTGPEL